MSKGYTGISFPFRISPKGGITMSTTSRYGVPHIVESIEQILGTMKRGRVNELEFGSDIDTQIFEPNDLTTHNFIRYQVLEALEEYEPRILVEEGDIHIIAKDEKIYAIIDFMVISYQSSYTIQVELREV